MFNKHGNAKNSKSRSETNWITEPLPILISKNRILLPGTTQKLDITAEEKQKFFLKKGNFISIIYHDIKTSLLPFVGSYVKVNSVRKTSQNSYKITVSSTQRIEIGSVQPKNHFLTRQARILQDTPTKITTNLLALEKAILASGEKIFGDDAFYIDLKKLWEKRKLDSTELCYAIIPELSLDPKEELQVIKLI